MGGGGGNSNSLLMIMTYLLVMANIPEIQGQVISVLCAIFFFLLSH